MIKNILLENFRSYEKRSFNLSPLTILIGPNGVGKTNVVEAIYLLSTGRSWRTRRDEELIEWNKDFCRIKAELDRAAIIELFLASAPEKLRQLKLNGVKHRVIDLLGQMPTVLFSPEEIELVSGAPSFRRRFLDVLLSQVNRQYAISLLELSKIIRGRNKLLFYIKTGKSKRDELEFWNGKLVELGSVIIKARQDLIASLNIDLGEFYQDIAGAAEVLQLKYKPAVELEHFRDLLGAEENREIEAAVTLFGPHRDDFVFLLDSRDLSTFGSRGEFRSAVLALKMAELKFLESHHDTKPILLLDDMFSELDARRRLHLSKLITDKQTIITTTDLDHLEKNLQKKAKVIEL